MVSDCIFCKIAAGQVPALRIHETPELLAFLDIGPLAPGHVLVIPRKHYQDIRDAAPETLAALAVELPRLARAVISATGATGLNVLQNNGRSSGQAVFHLHVHLIPRREGDGLGYRWNAGKYDGDAAAEMQTRLIGLLQGDA